MCDIMGMKANTIVEAINPKQIDANVHSLLSILGRVVAVYKLVVENVLVIVVDDSEELFVSLGQADKTHISDFLEQEWLKESTKFVLDTIKSSEAVKQLQSKYKYNDIILCLMFPDLVLSLDDKPIIHPAVSYSLTGSTKTSIAYLCLSCHCPVFEWAVYGTADFEQVHAHTPIKDIQTDSKFDPKYTIVDYIVCANCGFEVSLEVYCEDFVISTFEDFVRCALRPKLEKPKT